MKCALCPAEGKSSGIFFEHIRRGELVTLHVALCETHGNQAEKHIKRIIPKRLMEITSCVDTL